MRLSVNVSQQDAIVFLCVLLKIFCHHHLFFQKLECIGKVDEMPSDIFQTSQILSSRSILKYEIDTCGDKFSLQMICLTSVVILKNAF